MSELGANGTLPPLEARGWFPASSPLFTLPTWSRHTGAEHDAGPGPRGARKGTVCRKTEKLPSLFKR